MKLNNTKIQQTKPLLMCYSYEGFCRKLKQEFWFDGNLPSDWIFISIGEYMSCEREPHPLEENDQVINLNFDDISGYRPWDANPEFGWTEEYKELYKYTYGMNDKDTERLFSFLQKNIGKNVMIHCSAGISRSQGVVKFLLDCYPDIYKEENTNKDNPCRHPNLHVTSLLKKQFNK